LQNEEDEEDDERDEKKKKLSKVHVWTLSLMWLKQDQFIPASTWLNVTIHCWYFQLLNSQKSLLI
jgi:hypothetical protein